MGRLSAILSKIYMQDYDKSYFIDNIIFESNMIKYLNNTNNNDNLYLTHRYLEFSKFTDAIILHNSYRTHS